MTPSSAGARLGRWPRGSTAFGGERGREERIGSAYRARTRGDLDTLRVDLPVSSTSVALALRKRKGALRRRLVQEAGGSLGVSAMCVGVWLAVGAHAPFWPGWVIGLTLLGLGCGMRVPVTTSSGTAAAGWSEV